MAIYNIYHGIKGHRELTYDFTKEFAFRHEAFNAAYSEGIADYLQNAEKWGLKDWDYFEKENGIPTNLMTSEDRDDIYEDLWEEASKYIYVEVYPYEEDPRLILN